MQIARHSGFTLGRIALLTALVAVALASSLAAIDLETEYVLESRLLESELERYVEKRQRETQAIQEVRRIAGELDAVLADPNAAIAQMRALEARLGVARETAYLRLTETAGVRQRMYERMERLAEVARSMKTRESQTVKIDESGPKGLWKFRLQGIEVFALVNLDFEESALAGDWPVSGTYRNSNGHRGTLRGWFRSNALMLEVIDSRRGKVATLEGTAASGGRLSGTWTAVRVDMTPDQSQAGTWTAHRVSSEAEVSLD